MTWQGPKARGSTLDYAPPNILYCPQQMSTPVSGQGKLVKQRGAAPASALGRLGGVCNAVERIWFVPWQCVTFQINGIGGGTTERLWWCFQLDVSQKFCRCDKCDRFGWLKGIDQAELGRPICAVYLGVVWVREWLCKYIPNALVSGNVMTQACEYGFIVAFRLPTR